MRCLHSCESRVHNCHSSVCWAFLNLNNFDSSGGLLLIWFAILDLWTSSVVGISIFQDSQVPWPCLVVFCCNTRQYHITAKKDKARRYICMYLKISCHRGHLSLPKTTQMASIKSLKNIDTSLSEDPQYSHFSKNTQNEPWLTLLKNKGHLVSIERTQVGNKIKMTEPWRGTTDPFDRHFSPISLPPFYNHHCCRNVASSI